MRKIIFALLVAILTTIGTKAQQSQQLTFSTTIGTGIPMNSPGSVPFSWQVTGHYTIHERFSIGIGTGLSLYEKTIIPLFADAKFTLIKPRKFTPYVECAAGYGFAPGKSANGGIFLNPSVGIQHRVFGNKQLFLAIGYELQKLERLKKQEQSLFIAEFAEKLNHSSISMKIGFVF